MQLLMCTQTHTHSFHAIPFDVGPSGVEPPFEVERLNAAALPHLSEPVIKSGLPKKHVSDMMEDLN